jgi:thiamine biosynthesis lipoprotein
MGTAVSVDIPHAKAKAVFDAVFERLGQIDERFSTYKPDSEVSRFAGGQLDEKNLSAELTKVITACRQWEAKTDGWFSAWAAGAFDPSGYVKGWAVTEAGKVIDNAGFGTYCIGAGGDILAKSDSSKVWNIGIQDPNNTLEILNTLSISSGAVATSGSYERGGHIINPKTKKPAGELLSVTVTGPDIITADVLATAAFAESSGRLIDMHKAYNYLIVKNNDDIQTSLGWPILRSPGSNR